VTSLNGKQTSAIYRTITWENKSKAIFFYFHRSLGNFDLELTCSLFNINANTFDNWIRQKQYFPKWITYVQSFTAADVISKIPVKYQNNFDSVNLKKMEFTRVEPWKEEAEMDCLWLCSSFIEQVCP
jgi:hypothetical protein